MSTIIQRWQFPWGSLYAEFDGKECVAVSPEKIPEAGFEQPTPVPVQTTHSFTNLQEFFTHWKGVPKKSRGTPFQNAVWNYLESIPFGETRTYQQIAIAIGRPKATRAVGTAVGSNPWGVSVPCHRILPASGGIGGYFWGPRLKDFLLNAERRGR
jgi:methylated-DNA-[protein]-cysteine S-methyltransferase